VIVLVYRSCASMPTTQVTAGTYGAPGSGGAKLGTGTAGASGTSGSAGTDGFVITFQV
jgi:hypothetical protein